MVVSRRVIGHGRGLEAPPRAWLLEVGPASWPGAGAATPTMWAIRPRSRTTSPCPSRTRLAATRSRSGTGSSPSGAQTGLLDSYYCARRRARRLPPAC